MRKAKCDPKRRLSRDLDKISRGKSFEQIKKDYLVEEYDVPNDYEEFVNSINIFKKDYVFQGTVVYAEGTSDADNISEFFKEELGNVSGQIYKKSCEKSAREQKNIITLRPTRLSFVKKGENNYKIKIAFFYSHNSFLQGYLYDLPEDYLFLFNPTLTKRYLEQNKNIKKTDFVENTQVLLLEDSDDIDEMIEKVIFARFLNRGTVILYEDEETYSVAEVLIGMKHGEERMVPIGEVD